MAERTFYVIRDDNCKFESMTKAQILEAIEEALEQGYVSDPENAVFSRFKEINANNTSQIWIGTESQFNALTPVPQYTQGLFRLGNDNKIYFVNNDSRLAEIDNKLAQAEQTSGELDRIEMSLSALGLMNAGVQSSMLIYGAIQNTPGWQDNMSTQDFLVSVMPSNACWMVTTSSPHILSDAPSNSALFVFITTGFSTLNIGLCFTTSGGFKKYVCSDSTAGTWQDV